MTTATRPRREAAGVGKRWEVPLSDVRLPPDAIDAATKVLESGWLTSGPRVEQFEEEIADYLGCGHAVACSSGTAALHICLLALGVGPGAEVVMPSLTFVTSANVARHVGARPVFADITGGDDLTLDRASVATLIRPATRAVILMHYGGHACDRALVDVARERGVVVIEDATHALGTMHRGEMAGTWGEMGCFSFYGNKNLPLGEGGMIVTDHADLASTARQLRSYGLGYSGWERYCDRPVAYDVNTPGFNFKLDEMRAAIGSVLLHRFHDQIARRREVVRRYREELRDVPGVTLAFESRDDDRLSAHHLAVAILDDELSRDLVINELKRIGVQTGIHYPPIHLLTAYRTGQDLPQTDRLGQRILTLPLFAHMSPSMVTTVVEGLRSAVMVQV